MKSIKYYNRDGVPTVYTDDGVHLFLFDGRPAGYFNHKSIYSYEGVHLGIWDNGWIRDNSGRCVFFTESAYGGPLRPNLQVTPTTGIKHVIPVKKNRNVKPSDPAKSPVWSNLSGESFFEQTRTVYAGTIAV